MKINTWYQQTFSDKVIYFYVVKVQKNGGFAGIQVDYYLGSRAKPKKKKSSVPLAYRDLWKEVDPSHRLTVASFLQD
jgi:hypothetical protein